jgi:cytochrome c oxidase subunit 2
MPRRLRRAGLVVTATALLLVSGCGVDSEELKRLGQPEGASDRTDALHSLWMWSWLAAILTGILVWGLIGYVIIKYRRRSPDEIPVQTRYNLPLEVLYTLAPVVMVLVFFFFTVDVQNDTLEEVDDPDHVVEVVGQQWSWTFNYVEDDALDGETTVFQPGDPANPPTLYLVEGESVRFNLHSPDVIHSFWVPGFLTKLDVVPGLDNSFDLTPTRQGEFVGKCAELCGVYHSRMLFNVEVVDRATFTEKLEELEAAGNIGPACGSTAPDTIVGLDEDGEGTADEDREQESTGDTQNEGVCK